MVERLTSPANPRVKAWAALKDRKGRRSQGRFLIEGRREVRRAIEAGLPIEVLLRSPELHVDPADIENLAATAAARGASVIELSPEAFAKVSMRARPDGVAAVAPISETDLAAVGSNLDNATPLVLVVEGVEKPGNLGAMIRTADAAGVDLVIVADPTVDPFNPNVVRASQGSLFAVPVAVADGAATRAFLATSGVAAIAASPDADTDYWDADLTAPAAVVIGSEHAGLSPIWADAVRVRIPMRGIADSLNASVAAALVLYEALRQRR